MPLRVANKVLMPAPSTDTMDTITARWPAAASLTPLPRTNSRHIKSQIGVALDHALWLVIGSTGHGQGLEKSC